MLLSVIWCGRSPEYADFRAHDLERELRLCGLIRDTGVPTKGEASADVQYSLRLTRGDHLNDPDRPFAEPARRVWTTISTSRSSYTAGAKSTATRGIRRRRTWRGSTNNLPRRSQRVSLTAINLTRATVTDWLWR